MKPLFLLTLGAIAACAQPFSAGVKVGLPLTNFIDTVNSGNLTASSNTDRFIVGVTAELRLPFGLGVEGDVLYGRFNYNITTLGLATGSTSSNAWEFPLLVKYRFPSHIVRPFVDGGIAWDHVDGLANSILSAVQLSNVAQKTTTRGAVLGVGVEVKAAVIRISPEIRYIRWTDQHLNLGNVLQSNQNQAEFLVGITF
jgi:Outer membrane protein beta-barrel domain